MPGTERRVQADPEREDHEEGLQEVDGRLRKENAQPGVITKLHSVRFPTNREQQNRQ